MAVRMFDVEQPVVPFGECEAADDEPLPPFTNLGLLGAADVDDDVNAIKSLDVTLLLLLLVPPLPRRARICEK